jgi:antitoxin MazE
MVKTLSQIGNSYGIIIDRPIMDLLGITAETQLKMTVRDGGLLIQPMNAAGEHKDRVRKSAKKMAASHREALKGLAD